MFDVQRSVLSRVYAGLNRFRPWQATAFENVRSRGTGPCFSYRSQAPEVYFNYAKIYFLGNGKLAVQRVYFLEKGKFPRLKKVIYRVRLPPFALGTIFATLPFQPFPIFPPPSFLEINTSLVINQKCIRYLYSIVGKIPRADEALGRPNIDTPVDLQAGDGYLSFRHLHFPLYP